MYLFSWDYTIIHNENEKRWHRQEYSKYRKCLSMTMLVCIKQHLRNTWSSIREQVKQHWSWVKKKRRLRKRACMWKMNECFPQNYHSRKLEKSLVFSEWFCWKNINITDKYIHVTKIPIGITCKIIPCYMHDSACRWLLKIEKYFKIMLMSLKNSCR